MEAGSHNEFCKYGGQNQHPLRRLKNEFSMLWSLSVPNFMLVDKSAHYPLPLKVPEGLDFGPGHIGSGCRN